MNGADRFDWREFVIRIAFALAGAIAEYFRGWAGGA
jgi:hypothetical protein